MKMSLAVFLIALCIAVNGHAQNDVTPIELVKSGGQNPRPHSLVEDNIPHIVAEFDEDSLYVSLAECRGIVILTITTEEEDTVESLIFHANGEEMEASIDISHYSAGVYNLSIMLDSGDIYAGQFEIESH